MIRRRLVLGNHRGQVISTLEESKAGVGAGKTFPALKVTMGEGDETEDATTFEIVLSIMPTLPSAENLTTLKLAGKP